MLGYVDVLGFVAGALTTLALVPEILKTAKMKETHDLSLIWLGMLGTGTFLWTGYGVAINSYPILIANALSFVTVVILFALKLKYR
jgi:MtN3 and saliva related transmembrane protein